MNDNHAATWGILLAFLDVGFLTILGVILIIAMSWSERSQDTTAKNTSGTNYPPAVTLLWRAMLHRCPVCGKGAMFRSYFAMKDHCSSCGAVFWKNEGEWMGPMVMDYSAAGAAALLSWLVTSWYDLSGIAQFLLPVGATIVVGLAAIPWSRSLWTFSSTSPRKWEAPRTITSPRQARLSSRINYTNEPWKKECLFPLMRLQPIRRRA